MQQSSDPLLSIVTILFVIVVVCVVLGLLYWMVVYNGLVTKRNAVRSTFSGIDVQLKKRWDLIPRLVEVVKGYAAHEKEVFMKVTEARKLAMESRDDDYSRMSNEQVIAQETPKIMALAEKYPELKADDQFLWLQRNLTEIESQISASRRAYNATVLRYNNSLQTFPSSIIASKHEFKAMDFFSIELTERQNVRV